MTQNNLFHIIWYDELASTNEKTKTLLKETKLDEFTVIATKNQFQGKGQANNQWESEEGKNLTFSLFIKPTYFHAADQFVISKVVCLGILDVFSRYSNGFSIKWPNDIYYNNDKIGGILIENTLIGHSIGESVIGIGLNINQTKFVSNAPNPISLANILNKQFDIGMMLNQVLQSILKYLEIALEAEDFKSIDLKYIEHLFRNKGYHLFKDNDKTFKACIQGISEYGQLILSTESGEIKTYAFKEVEFIL